MPHRPDTSPRKLSLQNNQPFFSTLFLALTFCAVVIASPKVFADDKKPAGAEKAKPTKQKTDSKSAEKKNEEVIVDINLEELSNEIIMLAIDDELRRSEAVDGHRIDVDIDQGIVTLSGHVNNLLARQVAVGLAERVRGTVSVIDEMVVNTTSTRRQGSHQRYQRRPEIRPWDSAHGDQSRCKTRGSGPQRGSAYQWRKNSDWRSRHERERGDGLNKSGHRQFQKEHVRRRDAT